MGAHLQIILSGDGSYVRCHPWHRTEVSTEVSCSFLASTTSSTRWIWQVRLCYGSLGRSCGEVQQRLICTWSETQIPTVSVEGIAGWLLCSTSSSPHPRSGWTDEELFLGQMPSSCFCRWCRRWWRLLFSFHRSQFAFGISVSASGCGIFGCSCWFQFSEHGEEQ